MKKSLTALIATSAVLAVAPNQSSRTHYIENPKRITFDINGDGRVDLIKIEKSEFWLTDYKLISPDYLNPQIEFPTSTRTPENLDPEMIKNPSDEFFYK